MITTAIEAIADMLGKLFNWRTSATENKSITEVIDDKQDLEKACRYAEEAITLAQKHCYFDSVRDERRFENLVKKFRKYR